MIYKKTRFIAETGFFCCLTFLFIKLLALVGFSVGYLQISNGTVCETKLTIFFD